MEIKLLMLLNIIFNKGSIKKIIRDGVTYKEIPALTDIGIEKGFIIYEEEKISLSELGYTYLIENISKIKLKTKSEWIEKDKKNQIPKIGINDIFLPSKDSLIF